MIAVLLSLVGAYYYLRIIKTMFFDEPKDTTPVGGDTGATVLLALSGLAVLLFGPFSDGLMSLCRDAVLKAINS